jgi:hypothetical protein
MYRRLVTSCGTEPIKMTRISGEAAVGLTGARSAADELALGFERFDQGG